jgi:arginase
VRIAVVVLSYNVLGKGEGGGSGPEALLRAGLPERLRSLGHEITGVRRVELSGAEEKQYGGWNRVGLAGAHLASMVAGARREGDFVLGLLADCNGVLGMLGGLQRGESANRPRRAGLVYVDAHGDYNTPETSPSGMLGGMPVAVAAGKALPRMRKQNGIQVPLQSPDIVMAGLRDLDELERQALEEDGIEVLRERDLIEKSPRFHSAMEYLTGRQDIVYVHVDLDILDPVYAPAAGLPSQGGLTGEQLGEALHAMLAYPKTQALAVVSYQADADKDGRTQEEVLRAVLGALR